MPDDLSDPWVEIRKLRADLDRLQSARPLENASVSNGRLRFIGGVLRVDSGGRLEVVGSMQIDGSTVVTGTFNVDGPWSLDGTGNITGDVTITGRLDAEGPWSLEGDGDITGNVDLTGELNVAGSGMVKVGSAMRLNPNAEGGSIEFNTGRITGSSGAMGMYFGNGGFLALNGSGASIVGTGAGFHAEGSPRISGIPTKSATATGLPVGVVHIDSSGHLYHIVN